MAFDAMNDTTGTVSVEDTNFTPYSPAPVVDLSQTEFNREAQENITATLETPTSQLRTGDLDKDIDFIDNQLKNPNLSMGDREKLVDQEMLLKEKKEEAASNPPEDPVSTWNTDTDRAIEITSIGAEQIAAAFGLSPEMGRKAFAAASSLVSFVKENHQAKDVSSVKTTDMQIAGANETKTGFEAPDKQPAAEVAVASLDDKKTDGKEASQKEKDALATDMKDSMTRAAPVLTTFADREAIDKGVDKLNNKEDVTKAKNSLAESTAEILRTEPGSKNEALAQRVEDTAKPVLAIADVSMGRTGDLPPQAIGEVQKSRGQDIAGGGRQLGA